MKIYVNAWLKGQVLDCIEQFEKLDNGIAVSGSVRIPTDSIDELIAYLQDEKNVGQYGVELAISLFYNPDVEGRKPTVTGNIKPSDDNKQQQGKSKLKSKRSVF